MCSFLHPPPRALLSLTSLPSARGVAHFPERLQHASRACLCLLSTANACRANAEIFLLFFFPFSFWVKYQSTGCEGPCPFASCHGLLLLNGFPMKSINKCKSSGSWHRVKTHPPLFCCAFYDFFLKQTNALSFMAYFGQTSKAPILLCVFGGNCDRFKASGAEYLARGSGSPELVSLASAFVHCSHRQIEMGRAVCR